LSKYNDDFSSFPCYLSFENLLFVDSLNYSLIKHRIFTLYREYPQTGLLEQLIESDLSRIGLYPLRLHLFLQSV